LRLLRYLSKSCKIITQNGYSIQSRDRYQQATTRLLSTPAEENHPEKNWAVCRARGRNPNELALKQKNLEQEFPSILTKGIGKISRMNPQVAEFDPTHVIGFVSQFTLERLWRCHLNLNAPRKNFR
jgi:hypothetical protein